MRDEMKDALRAFSPAGKTFLIYFLKPPSHDPFFTLAPVHGLQPAQLCTTHAPCLRFPIGEKARRRRLWYESLCTGCSQAWPRQARFRTAHAIDAGSFEEYRPPGKRRQAAAGGHDGESTEACNGPTG